MPYDRKQYEKYNVKIEDSTLTDKEELEIKNYVQGIYDGDQMYIKLVNYLKEVQEPTILVMFGDHLPALNNIYQKNQYNDIDYYTTPYVIWAKYDIENDTVLSISKGYFTISNSTITLDFITSDIDLTLNYTFDGDKLTLSSETASLVLTKKVIDE